MARHQLTDTAIRNAKPREREYLLSDGGGLHLRIRPNGTRDWLFTYTFGDKRKKMGLGSYKDTPLATARREAEKARDSLAQIIDPQTERKVRVTVEKARADALIAQQTRTTVQELFELWASVDLIRRKDGGAEARRILEKDVLPKIGRLAVRDIQKGHITRVTDALLARGVTRMAKVVFSLMRQMLRFAVDRDIIEFDPTSAIRKAKIGGKDTERDRVLTEAELRLLTVQIENASLSKATIAATWIALSTCCRIGELTSAQWAHIDLKAGIWWIPSQHSKNGKAHTVYLSTFAQAQFESLRAIATEAAEIAKKQNPAAKMTEWVYPNRHNDGPISTKTITKQLGDRQRGDRAPMQRRVMAAYANALSLPGGRWTPHDLRRTGATMMVALGVIPEVAERCLNHTEENRVKRTYQRHSYEREMREAWRLLGERIALLTTDDTEKVATLAGWTANRH